MRIDRVNVPAKCEVRIALPVPEIRGGSEVENPNLEKGEALGSRGWYRSKERW